MNYILYCKLCESFSAVNEITFKEYDNKEFKCGNCSGKHIDEEIIIDSRLFINKRKQENENVEVKSKKRRKSDIKKLED